eukprot:GHVH01000245.1.p1 GENE.GHVH01000245.1~~GHVH01000245.1.p1  ORF type:complete len:244 (+),score=39.29 GHVH01000245.1:148-879(+)
MESNAPAVPLPEVPETSTPNNCKLFVSNLNFKVRDEDLEPIFAKFGPLKSCEVKMISSGISRGYALVEFEEEKDAEGAIATLNDTEIMERPITVRLDMDISQRPRNNLRNSPARKSPNPRPQSSEFSAKRRVIPYGKQLFIGNLAFKTSWQDLKDEFRTIGDVQRAEVFTTIHNGYRRSKGCGIVVMENEEDAKRCIELKDNSTLHDRQIVVRMDAPPGERPNFVPAEHEGHEGEYSPLSSSP